MQSLPEVRETAFAGPRAFPARFTIEGGTRAMPQELERPTTEREPGWKIALREANRVRLVRAVWKRRIERQPTGEASRELLADVLSDPPEDLHGMELGELIGACRRVGPVAIERYVHVAEVRSTRQVADLTARQRWMLIGVLRAPRQGARSY